MKSALSMASTALLAITFCAPLSLAQTPTTTDQDSFPVPPANVRQLRLDNGLEVLMIQLPNLPLVGLSTQVRVGSVQEDWSSSGMSHMLEHLLFNGTGKRTQKQLYDEVDRLGGYNNAHTTNWYTNYMMLVPPSHLEQGMDIQSDMLFFSTLPVEKFDKERGIVLEEIAQGRDGQTGMDRMRAEWEHFLYKGSSQELPTLGTPQSLRAINRDQVYDFYQTWYRPNNSQLTIMGPIDFAECQAFLEHTYGAALPGPMPDWKSQPAQWPLGQKISRRDQLDAAHLWLAWPAPDLRDSHSLEARAFTETIASPDHGLLLQALFMEGLPPFPNLDFELNTEPGIAHFSLRAELPPGLSPEAASAGLQAAMKNLATLQAQPELLERWVLAQRSSEALLREKPHYFGMSHAADLVHVGAGPLLQLDKRLSELRFKNIQQQAGIWMSAQPAEFLALPLGPSQNATLADQSPSVQIENLDSGARLSISAESSSEIFALTVLLKHRSAWEGPHRSGAIDLLHRILADSPDMSRLHDLGATLDMHDQSFIPYDDYRTSSRFSFVRMEVLAEHSEEACRALMHLLKDTRITQDQLDEQRKAALQRVTKRTAKASDLARAMMKEKMLSPSPSSRDPEGDEAGLRAVQLSEILLLRSMILQPANLVLAMNTPAKATEMISLWDELLPPSDRSDALRELQQFHPDFNPAPTQHSLQPLPAKAPMTVQNVEFRQELGSAQSVIRLGSRFESSPEDGAALRILFSIISDRMAFDLRETRGWAYRLGAWASSNAGISSAGATIGTRPENREEALKEMRGYLREFDAKSLTAEEVEKTVNSILGYQRMRLMSSVNQCWYRSVDLLSGDPGASDNAKEQLALVQKQDVKRVARKYLKQLKWITIVIE